MSPRHRMLAMCSVLPAGEIMEVSGGDSAYTLFAPDALDEVQAMHPGVPVVDLDDDATPNEARDAVLSVILELLDGPDDDGPPDEGEPLAIAA